MSPRDQLLKALFELQQGAYIQKKTTAQCDTAYQAARKLVSKVQPQDDDDTQVKNAGSAISANGPQCFAKAGDCDASYAAYKESLKLRPNMTPEVLGRYTEETYRRAFESAVHKCRGK